MEDKICVINMIANNPKSVFWSDYLSVDINRISKSLRLHYHTCYEFEILISGELLLQINNDICVVDEGSFWFSLPNDIHKIKLHSDNAVLFTMKFTDKALSTKMYNCINMIQKNMVGTVAKEYIQEYIQFADMFMREYNAIQSGVYKDIFARRCFEMILSYFTDKMVNSTMDFEHGKSNNSTIFEAISFIKHNFRRQLTIRELSERSHYTPNYFTAKFKEIVGCGVVEFINNERLRQAYYILSTSDMTVNEVAEYVGFDSISYFSKTFKKKYGITPSKIIKIVE